MKLATLGRCLVILTAMSLNLVLLWGLATQEAVAGQSTGFAVLVNVMLCLLLASSLAVMRMHWHWQRGWSLAFGVNFLLVLLPSLLKSLGAVTFGPPFLFCLDVYWLNLCLVYLARMPSR